MQPRISLDSQNASRFTLHDVRIAYAQDLNAPRAMAQADGSSGTPRFSCVVLVPEAAADVIQGIQGVMWQLIQSKFGQKAQGVWQELMAANRLALKNGALKASKDGFAGNWFITPSAKAERPPLLFHKFLKADGTGVEALQRPQSVIYSGCYVNIQLAFWVQDNNYGKRVNADLLAVQFAGDGEAFGGGASGADTSVFGGVAAPNPFAGMPPPQAPTMAPPAPPSMMPPVPSAPPSMMPPVPSAPPSMMPPGMRAPGALDAGL